MYQALLVGLGGFIGSILRYGVGVLCKNHLGASLSTDFPFGTLLVNIVGSFLIGLALVRPELSENQKLLLVTGVLGGFTTFSAFSWEALELLNQQKFTYFAYYFGLTLALGLLAAYLGSKI